MEEKLQKEIRILKKKLARSEKNRALLESIRDKNSRLFETYNEEINVQKQLVQEKKEQLEMLTSKLAKYLSPHLYSSIFTGDKDVRVNTYKKPLTIFFSNIIGFTERSETMDDRDLSDWLNQYLDRMAGIAQRFGGTLDKFIGDSVMIFFGDPNSNGTENDAKNCLSMAMAMRQEAMSQGIDIRMGINSGDCTIGSFGSIQRMEYTVIGTAVNIAHKLEKNSQAGKILISENCFDLIKDFVYTEPGPSINIKGLNSVLMTYWVTEDFFRNG